MLKVDSISLRYEQREIIKQFSFEVKRGEILSIIGPNGSGKSTLLKGLTRLVPYHAGKVELDGVNLKSLSAKEAARKICMLSQRNMAPSDMTVHDLVTYGRYPHKKWYEKLNKEDNEIVAWALAKTYMTSYAERPVSALSGGESQRAWIAMALAQRPEVLLLDEPTTYLDISHQHEVLELVRELNQEMGMTVLMVLHDLNQASRYSDQIIVMQSGEKMMHGSPSEVMRTEMISSVFQMEADIQFVTPERNPRIHLTRSLRAVQ